MARVNIEGCTATPYHRSCCRKHYYEVLRSAYGPCIKCSVNNRRSSKSDLCHACFEQTDERKTVHYMAKYGITVEEYNAMFIEQDGVCAICKQPPSGNTAKHGRMCIDHNHRTGQVRKLLCFNCNTAIGKMNDNPELLRKAAEYLEQEGN